MQDDRMNKKARAECLKVMEDSIDIDVAMSTLETIFQHDRVEDARKVRIAAGEIKSWVDRLERAASTLGEEDA